MKHQAFKSSQPAMHAPLLAMLACTSCNVLLAIDDPMEKFTRFRKIVCHRCGQPHRMDLYFMGERDCFGLVPVTKPQTLSPLDEDE